MQPKSRVRSLLTNLSVLGAMALGVSTAHAGTFLGVASEMFAAQLWVVFVTAKLARRFGLEFALAP